MVKRKHDYEVVARLREPDIAGGRRYVAAEGEYIRRQLQQSRKSWPLFSYPKGGILRTHDWRQYEDTLHKYARQLGKHEQDMKEGLLPFEFVVTNLTKHTDRDISVRLEVKNGAIHDKVKAPRKPNRPDGTITEHKRRSPFAIFTSIFGDFTRRKIQIGRHSVAAEFSTLGPGDSALVVNQVLYIQCLKNTEFEAVIQSKHCVLGRSRVKIEA